MTGLIRGMTGESTFELRWKHPIITTTVPCYDSDPRLRANISPGGSIGLSLFPRSLYTKSVDDSNQV